MANQLPNSHSEGALRESSGAGMRTGVAKDQLIFTIICSVALAVAAVTLVHFFTGRSKGVPIAWQCLACGHEFSMKPVGLEPVECPKCGGETVRLGYRFCKACDKQVLVARTRVPKHAQGAGGPAGGPPARAMMMPMEIQYRIKQADGSFTWTSWMLGGSPKAIELSGALVCPECGASLLIVPPSGG